VSGWPPGGEALHVEPLPVLRAGDVLPRPSLNVLGVDPGSTTGLCLLGDGPHMAFSCNYAAAVPLAMWLIEVCGGPEHVHCVGEAFAPGRGAGARQQGAAVTRALITQLDGMATWRWRTASEVKPWATDKRLAVAGLLELTSKMRDARDAARHALFSACRDLGQPDPLSSKQAWSRADVAESFKEWLGPS
jgi:hypothetical protein